MDFLAASTASSDAGSYTIQITANATMTDGTSGNLSSTFPIDLKIATCS